MEVGRERRGRWAQGCRRLRSTALLLLVLATGGACLTASAAAKRGAGGVSPVPPAPHTRNPLRGRAHTRNPLRGRAMWIWELSQSQGGNLGSIAASARHYRLTTVIIKSSDGTSFWTSQFSSHVVAALHAGGLHVCAWQYVYGNHPITEARMGVDAVRDGADCLIIDAEAEYQGKYISAQSYIRRLRARIGKRYPVALAGFPYIDYHPGFPYSVFLGPGGAQYNAPQMYWRDIGTTTDGVFAHTYEYNRIYQRPIYPLGQIYGSPPAHQIFRFRRLSRSYGASGVSWWDWQTATPTAWTALSRPAGPLRGYVADPNLAAIGEGATGDLVIWAQEHLISAGYPIPVSGDFGSHTLLDVEAFQSAHGLAVDGVIGTDTWKALLRYRAARITWSTRHRARVAMSIRAPKSAQLVAPVPDSAHRPQRRDEIAAAGGRGGRPGR